MKYLLWWAEQSHSTLKSEMARDEEGLLRAVDRAGMEEAWVLLQHPPCYAVACCIPKKAERGLGCFKYKVGVCPSSQGGA